MGAYSSGCQHRRGHLPRAVSLLLLTVSLMLSARCLEAKPMVMAFYYTWYGSRDFSGAWRHWNEGGHQPDHLGSGGMPDIGATDHPVELYDSHDPALLRRHLKVAQECGIDALIPTWWGPGDWHDEALALLLKEARSTSVKVSAYYETIPAGQPDKVAATAKSLLSLLETHGSSPAFLKDAKGAPVIFVYSRAMGQLTRDEWAEALRRVRASHAVCAIADSTDASWLDLFDGLHEYNPVGAVVAGEDLKARAAGLVSAARSKPGHKIACATVIPGYDDSHNGRATPIIAPRAGGDTYRRMWSAALDAKPDWVLVCSFNEWHEGSEIEASREWGDRYQRLTWDFSRLLHSGKQVVLKGTGLSGVDVRPTPGLFVSMERNGKGPVTLRNLALVPGVAEVRWGRPEDVVAFELGPEDRLWRLVPSEGPQKGPLRVAMGSGRSYQVWKRDDLAEALPRSPFAGPTSLRLAPKVSSSYPASEPNRYRVFPGHPFPIEVSLQNRGRATVTGGHARLQAPEGWGSGEATLFNTLAPGSSARARLEVTPPASADLNQPYPVLVWLSFTEGGRVTTFWAPVQLTPERPLEPSFSFGGDGSLRIAIKSAFPDLTLEPVTLDLVAGEGRSAEPSHLSLRVAGSAEVSAIVTRGSEGGDRLRRTLVTLRLGDYSQLISVVDTASIELGPKDAEHGLMLVEPEDGRTTPAPDGAGRMPVPFANGQSAYLYLRLPAAMPRTGDTYLTVEYLDKGRSTLAVQYDSQDASLPMSGAYKPTESLSLGDTGRWLTHTFRLPDGRLAGRQNGAADLRLVLSVPPTAVRSVAVTKWPPKG